MQAGPVSGRIGPNAILQLVPVLEERLGRSQTRTIMAQAHLARLPDGQAMIAEEDAARLHQAVRFLAADQAREILREAGLRTANYILAHRIPRFAQIILRLLPAPIAARLLSRAIAHHAWTFVGTGQFRVVTPWLFEITQNPLIAHDQDAQPLCVWHEAVFEHLYRVLVTPHAQCREIECSAQGGSACRFEIEEGKAQA